MYNRIRKCEAEHSQFLKQLNSRYREDTTAMTLQKSKRALIRRQSADRERKRSDGVNFKTKGGVILANKYLMRVDEVAEELGVCASFPDDSDRDCKQA